MKQNTIILIGLIFVIIAVMGNQILQDNSKILFLEDALATKNLHYGWLEEITNSLINEKEFQEKCNVFKESRDVSPKI